MDQLRSQLNKLSLKHTHTPLEKTMRAEAEQLIKSLKKPSMTADAAKQKIDDALYRQVIHHNDNYHTKAKQLLDKLTHSEQFQSPGSLYAPRLANFTSPLSGIGFDSNSSVEPFVHWLSAKFYEGHHGEKKLGKAMEQAQMIFDNLNSHRFDIPQFIYRADKTAPSITQTQGLVANSHTNDRNQNLIDAVRHTGSSNGLGAIKSFSASSGVASSYAGKQSGSVYNHKFDTSRYNPDDFIATPDLLLDLAPELIKKGDMEWKPFLVAIRRATDSMSLVEKEVFYIGPEPLRAEQQDHY